MLDLSFDTKFEIHDIVDEVLGEDKGEDIKMQNFDFLIRISETNWYFTTLVYLNTELKKE